MTGELAIKGYIGWVEAKRVFAHQTWHLYTANSVKSHSLLSGAAWDAAPEASAYAPSDLSYLAEESDWAPAAVRTYAARAAQAELFVLDAKNAPAAPARSIPLDS